MGGRIEKKTSMNMNRMESLREKRREREGRNFNEEEKFYGRRSKSRFCCPNRKRNLRDAKKKSEGKKRENTAL